MTREDGWKTVLLGDTIAPVRRPVAIGDDRSYEQVTVRIKGRGLVSRGVVRGTAIAANTQYEVRTGDLLVSKIDARNGGLGLVPESLDGAVVSSDFPGYVVDEQRCLPSYLDLYVRRPLFWDECLLVSEGSTNRVRLVPEQFLELEIELPPLKWQAEVVAALAAEDRALESVMRRRDATETFFAAYRSELFERLAEAADLVPIGEFADLASGGTPSRRHNEYFGGDIPWVKTGEVAFQPVDTTEETLTDEGLRNSSARLFPAETVLVAMYGRGTVGRSAYITKPMATNQACAAVKPGPRHVPLYLFHYLWSAYEDLVEEAEGTTNLTNISLGVVSGFDVPLPDLGTQRDVVSRLERLVAARRAQAREHSAHVAFRAALVEDLVTGVRQPPSDGSGR